MAERDANSVSGVPAGDQGGIFYRVGQGYFGFADGKYQVVGNVSRITVTDDLPGLHCNMERVRVFDGDTVVFEGPLHNLEGVTYPAPGGTP